MNPPAQRSRLAGIVLWLPYAWLVAFFLLPFLIVLKISLSQSAIAQPPYTPVFDLSAGWSGIRSFFAGLSPENFVFLGSDPLRSCLFGRLCPTGRGASPGCAADDVVLPEELPAGRRHAADR